MGTKADFWKGHLVGWRDSGLTQAGYCRQRGLSLACFGYWRRVLGKVAASSALVPIVVGHASAPEQTIAVQLPNGLQAWLPVDMEPSRWTPVIRALHTC